jgi:ribosomal protein L11 methyltransferase
MFLWRKSAHPGWVQAHANILQAAARGALVIIERPGRRCFQLEIACNRRTAARALLEQFGGRVAELPRNWLSRIADTRKAKPIQIGKRLIVARPPNGRQGSGRPGDQRNPIPSARPDALKRARTTAQIGETRFLLIPASMAFGTGEHATTAMALRLLERLTRHWKRGWSLVDLGTGSGILALAAKRFGAGRVLAVDVDPQAISIAESNARLNHIHGITFRLSDLRKWKSAHQADIITANLYSDLLIEILSKLKRSGWMILSGILRSQETGFLRALSRNRIELISIARRGKWVAIIARCGGVLRAADFVDGKFLRRSQTTATIERNAN